MVGVRSRDGLPHILSGGTISSSLFKPGLTKFGIRNVVFSFQTKLDRPSVIPELSEGLLRTPHRHLGDEISGAIERLSSKNLSSEDATQRADVLLRFLDSSEQLSLFERDSFKFQLVNALLLRGERAIASFVVKQMISGGEARWQKWEYQDAADQLLKVRVFELAGRIAQLQGDIPHAVKMWDGAIGNVDSALVELHSQANKSAGYRK